MHVIDDADPHELRLALGPLLDRLPGGAWRQSLVVGAGARRCFAFSAPRRLHRVPWRRALPFLSAVALRDRVSALGADAVHTWSLDAGYAACLAVGGRCPVLVSVWDPHVCASGARRLLALRECPAVSMLCHTAIVRRRLIERGMPPDRCVVVRPGVDFGCINRLRRETRARSELQPDRDTRICLLPGPPATRGRQRLALWIMGILREALPTVALWVPGVSAEQRRIERLCRRSHRASYVQMTGDRYTFEELLCSADALLVPAAEDVSATPVAWAMAASVSIVACATYGITEFIADGQNGSLAKSDDVLGLTAKLARALRAPRELAATREAARGQAYQVFGMARYVEQVAHVYRNVLNGCSPGDGVLDSALEL